MRQIIAKLLGIGAVCALLLSVQPATAQCRPQPDPCCGPCTDWCDMCGDWEFGAHALYFSPFACEFDYATQTPSQLTQSGPVATVRCQLDWGFRLFARYFSDCNFASISYQWFGNKVTDSIDGLGTVRNLSGIPALRSTATVRIEYQNFDFRFGQYLHQSCGCNFYVFGNARWVDLLLSHDTRAISTTFLPFHANEKSKLEGGGDWGRRRR